MPQDIPDQQKLYAAFTTHPEKRTKEHHDILKAASEHYEWPSREPVRYAHIHYGMRRRLAEGRTNLKDMDWKK